MSEFLYFVCCSCVVTNVILMTPIHHTPHQSSAQAATYKCLVSGTPLVTHTDLYNIKMFSEKLESWKTQVSETGQKSGALFIRYWFVVELEVRSRGPTQVSHTGQKTFLPLGEMDLEQTLKLVLHHPPHPPENFSYLYATSIISSIERS